ncbi:MAG: PAS domain S-box-containing protein [Sneathiella sp.]
MGGLIVTVSEVPEYEEQRLEVLQELGLLDTVHEEGFDRLTRIAKKYFDVPIVLVSLVDENRLWFKSCQGIDVHQVGRAGSLCAEAILSDDILYVRDTELDPRFKGRRFVLGSSIIRFYAGYPLQVGGGLTVGTLCLMDTKPRTFTSDELIALNDFGASVEQQLHQSRLQNDAKFLVSQTSRLNTLLDTIADGIITVGEKGDIESFNVRVGKIFGYETYELETMNFNQLMPDLGHGGWNGFIEIFFGETRQNEREALKELRGRRKDGTLFPMDLVVRKMEVDGRQLYTGIIRDVTQRKADEDALRFGREILETTKENVPVGLTVFNADLELTVVNKLAQNMLNLPGEMLRVGVSFEDCLGYLVGREDFGKFDQRDSFEKQLEFARNPHATSFISNFGTDHQIEVSTRAMPGGGFVSTYMDITDRLRNAEKLESLLLQANTANLAKTDFLSTISHEIRTPLNGVIGVARMLGDTRLDEEQMNMLDTILRSGNVLLDLINDVLDMSKIEAGVLQVECISFDLLEAIQTVKSPFEFLASEKNIEFNTEISTNIAPHFKSDPTRIRQIIMNLLSNAFKFTEAGCVTLSVSVEPGGEENRQNIQILVSDTGVGIPANRQSAIFDSFSQVDNSVARKFGGTGLGLTIIKKLIGILGGQIRLESKEGEGSKFYVQLPLEICTEEPSERVLGDEGLADTPSRSDTPLHILIAEDNDVNLTILEASLTKLGHSFEATENGKLAVEKMESGHFDLVLMDVHMPEMDGIEATKKIRALKKGAYIPIVGLTAEAFAERHALFREIGMNDVLTKPFTEIQLHDIISRNRHDTAGAPVQQDKIESGRTVDDVGDPELFEATLRDPIGSDENMSDFQGQLGTDVVTMLLEKAPNSINKELVSLKEGLSSRDTERVGRAAHTIKGVASSLCAVRLANQAQLIEGQPGDWDEISGSLSSFERTIQETVRWWESTKEV